VDKSQGEFPQLSADVVVAEKPDFLLLSADNAQTLQSDARWAQLPAVQAGRVCVFSPAQIDIFSHHGPRMEQSARLIAQCLQGKIPSTLPAPQMPATQANAANTAHASAIANPATP